MAMKMATLERAEELLEQLRSTSWAPAVKGKQNLHVLGYQVRYLRYSSTRAAKLKNYVLKNRQVQTVLQKIAVRFSRSWFGCMYLLSPDLEDLKEFAIEQGAPEGNDMRHWDVTFWSERLREAKFNINEVNLSPFFGMTGRSYEYTLGYFTCSRCTCLS